jgi:phosphopantothenoylcysteine decarboxylase/phosphopantothenate--cysteine ligase
VSFVEPRLEEGKAKLATEEAMVLAAARAAGPSPLAGKTVVVTSGGTSEPIDPVRTISNRASGRTGRAVAAGCYARGADVVLVHDGPDVPYATVEQVESAQEMLEAVLAHADGADALVSAAAISDYTLAPSDEKIRSGQELTLELEPTPKLLDRVRESHPDLTIVGFKLETEGDDQALVAKAREQLDRAGLAFVVANRVEVMGQEDTRVLFVSADTVTKFRGEKDELGVQLAEELATVLAG